MNCTIDVDKSSKLGYEFFKTTKYWLGRLHKLDLFQMAHYRSSLYHITNNKPKPSTTV